MMEQDLKHLHSVLLKRRKDVFDRLHQFETDWQALGDRDIEMEEEAQKADIATLYDRLDERTKEEIEAIDLALCKMAAGSYGICEECESLIPYGRLEAIPETRLCLGCARRYEKKSKGLRRPRELMPCAALPEEYRNMGDEELTALIVEHLRNDGRIDLDELTISCRRGMVYLEGLLPDEGEHQILLQMLTDVMGLTSVVDLLGTDEVAWEREDRTPRRRRPLPADAEVSGIGSRDYTEDVLESIEDGIPYTPPEGPIPEKE
jgi:RNA polymerase-binding transcription factor DksA